MPKLFDITLAWWIPYPKDTAISVIGIKNSTYVCTYGPSGRLMVEFCHCKGVIGKQAVVGIVQTQKAARVLREWFLSYGLRPKDIGVRYDGKAQLYELVVANHLADKALLLDGLVIDKRTGKVYPKAQENPVYIKPMVLPCRHGQLMAIGREVIQSENLGRHRTQTH